MTQDDILRMAREAGLLAGADLASDRNRLFTVGLKHFADLVAAAEREACALICDERYNFEASRIAHIIRSRDAHAQNLV